MRARVSHLAVAALLLANAAAFGQSGGSKGSGDSGGERPFNGNDFRQDQISRPAGAGAAADPYQAGVNLLKDGKFAEAITHLDAAVARTPDDAAAWFYLGYAHQQSAAGTTAAGHDAEIDAAMRDFRHALRLDPKIRAAHQYLGMLFLQRHDAESAQVQADALRRLCPSGCDERGELEAAIAKQNTGSEH